MKLLLTDDLKRLGLNKSRQQLWAERNVRNGLCSVCSDPRVNARHCAFHRDRAAEYRMRAYRRAKLREGKTST